jgi:hypothetical protein
LDLPSFPAVDTKRAPLQWSTDDDADDGGVSGGSPAKAPLRLSSPSVGASFKPKEHLGGGRGGSSAAPLHAKKINDSSMSLKRRWSDEEVENLKKGVERYSFVPCPPAVDPSLPCIAAKIQSRWRKLESDVPIDVLFSRIPVSHPCRFSVHTSS